MSGPVRLPGVPFEAFEPPPVRADEASVRAQRLEADENQELFAVTQDLPSRGLGNPGTPAQQLVYKTLKAWRACDVFVAVTPDPSGAGVGGVVSVFIYAVNAGVRTLVASGRTSHAGGGVVVPAKWLGAARTVSNRFEVSILATQDEGSVASAAKVTVVVVASNEATAVPDDLGAESAARVFLRSGVSQTMIGPLSATAQLPARVELVSVQASSNVAAARWLMLFDAADGTTPANNSRPLLTWPLGAVVGEGIVQNVRFRANGNLFVMASSTFNLLTAVADCAVSGMVR